MTLDRAEAYLQKARSLAPQSSQIQLVSGFFASMQGHAQETQAYFRQAMALEPQHLQAVYALAQWLEPQGDTPELAEAQRLLAQLLTAQPDNLAVLLELARVAAKNGDLAPLQPIIGPLWFIASGWIRPTDSSINVAISQGQHTPPRSLRLEVPDSQGDWVVAKANLGFPAGKHKNTVLNLQGL